MKILATESIVNGLLRIQGADSEKFLQGQLTCDIKKLDPKRAMPGAYCTPQGRIRASFVILKLADDDFLMLLPRPQVKFLIDALSPYIAFFKSEISDESDQWHVVGILRKGQDEYPADNQVLNQLPPLPEQQWESNVSDNLIWVKIPGTDQRWYGMSKTPLMETLTDVKVLDPMEWKIQDICSGFVWINETNREQFVPHDLSLPDFGAVSFEKGCYTGQEIVARMQFRGEPKYLLAVIKTSPTDSQLPDKLMQAENGDEASKIGTVIQKVHLPDNSWLFSASVKKALVSEQQVRLLFPEGAIIATISQPNKSIM